MDRDDRAASERATAQIRAVAATVRAPARLRAAVAQERLAGGPSRRPGGRGIVVAAIGSAVALGLALLIVALPTGTSGGSVADAADVALRPPTGAPPRAAGGSLRLAVGGVSFPDYAQEHGWRPVGTRADRIAGRTAVTVHYARGAQRVGYTIVDGAPLSVPAGTSRVDYEGLEVAVLRSGDARYVTWQRDGRTCVLATREAELQGLLELAAAAPRSAY